MATGSAVAMSPVDRAEARLKKIEEEQGKGAAETPQEPSQEQAPDSATKKPETEQSQTPDKGHQEPKQESQKGSDKPAEGDSAPSADPNDQSWEQKYKSLNGMLPRLRRENEALKGELGDLREKLESLDRKESSTPDNALPQEGEALQEHLKALHEEFGEEFVTYLKTLIRSEATGVIDSRVKPVEQKVEQGEASHEEMRRANFKSDLARHVPDWESIYDSDDFDNWLHANTEQLSGKTYDQLFREANDNWNLTAMVRFFSNFKQATGRAPAERASQPSSDPRENLVVPDSSGNATPNAVQSQEGNKKIWREDEVRKFYKDAQMGRYVGREDEYSRIDAEIFRANLEDRIRA